MKKLICLVLSAVLALGALSLFAGCAESEVKDKAKKAEVLAAFDSAEASAFDMTMETSVEASSESDESASETTVSERTDITAYEEDSLVYGDMYMTVSADSSYRSETYTSTESSKNYVFGFARGKEAYAASGEWKDRGVKAGDFDALVEDYRKTAEPLTSTDISALFDPDSFVQTGSSVSGAEEYLGLATQTEGKVFETSKGYRIEYDFVEEYRNLAKKLEAAAPFYAENPDCTVSELFEAAGLAGFEDFFFLNAIYDGSMPAEVCIGPSESFAENMKDLGKNTEKELIGDLFGIEIGEGDKASFTFKVSAELDGKLAFKDLSMTLKVSAEANLQGTKTKFKADISLEAKACASKPAVRSLTGLTAALTRPDAGTYPFQKIYDSWSTSLYESESGEYLDGDLTGNAVVQEDGTTVVTLTFTGENEGCPAVTETWTVDLTAIPDGGRAEHVFFTDYMGGSYLGITAEIYAGPGYYEIYGPYNFQRTEIPEKHYTVTL